MFDALIKLLQTILDYAKHQKQDESQFVTTFLEPLFKEIEGTASNYITFFHAFLAILESSDDWYQSVASVKERRDELHLKRKEILAKVDGIQAVYFSEGVTTAKDERSKKRTALCSFLCAVDELFRVNTSVGAEHRAMFPSLVGFLDKIEQKRRDSGTQRESRSAAPIQLFEFLAYQDANYPDAVAGNNAQREELREFLKRTIRDLETQWHKAVETYIQLQLLIRGPKSLLQKPS